ncbi:MAG TPA: hypothetical protein VIJ96_06915 [Acidothermaceae bacterium]
MSRHGTPRRPAPKWVVVARYITPLLALGALITKPVSHADVLGPRAAIADATAPSFTKTEKVARTNLVLDGNPLTNDATGNPLPQGTMCSQPTGCTEQVDQRTVALSVDVTTGLQTYQQLTVSWSGAHPTNFINSDPTTNVAGSSEEYPMVLMECRGVDDSSKPAAQQLSPQTCWTEYDAERFGLSLTTEYPPWRLDLNASQGDRAQFVNQPNPLPTPCFGSSDWTAAHTVPLVAADGTTYNQYTCGGARAPEQLNQAGANSQGVPDNTTFSVTHADGNGLSKFVVWTDETNATVGCSSTVACSLVAIPIMGISCDETTPGASAADLTSCEYQDSQSGVVADGGANHARSFSVEGDAWWSASNWDDRIVVPLNFAPPANYCSIVSTKAAVLIYGSELMTEAAQQWAPTFCTDPNRTPFSHVAEAEPAAVNSLVAGTTEAAFDSYPPPPASTSATTNSATGPPIVNAPVAISGFAISTLVDDNAGREVTNVRLDARLLAKLLTESYPITPDIARGDGGTWTTQTDPATGKPEQVLTSPGPMVSNPVDIVHDPEFIALNPTLAAAADTGGEFNAAELIALSSNSDVMHALTSYINADPAAAAFIDGQPDPWGMVVNPAYKGTLLPTDFWPLNDSWINTGLANASPCWGEPQVQVPYMPLVAAPLLYLRNVTQDMEFGLTNSTLTCNLQQDGSAALTTEGRQQPALRFELGVVSTSEASLYGLDTAELESQSVVTPSQQFTNADAADSSKFSFVGPTVAAMAAAADQLAADPSLGTWTLDYAKLRSSSAGEAAYPGTMLVSMSVPTVGLSSTDAAGYASLLSFAVGDGQTPGTGFGQLPAGYLPLTASNGLGQLVGYTQRAAAAVANQQCALPDLTDSNSSVSTYSSCPQPSPSPSPSPSQTASATATSTPAPSATTLEAPTVAAAQPTTARPVIAPTTSPPPSPTFATTAPASAAVETPTVTPDVLPTGATPSSPVGPVGSLVPLLLFVGAVGGTASLVVNAIGDLMARRAFRFSR